MPQPPAPRRPAPARARTRRGLPRALLAMTAAALLASACGTSTDAPDPHDLAVTMTPPTGPFTAGEQITWTVVVVNKGPGQSGPVTITGTTDSTCAASGNAACPTDGSNTVGNIPAGGRLTFSFKRTLPVDGLGVQDLAFSVASDQDSDATNDAAAFTVTMDESRSGTYRLFAADGRTYDLTLDFTQATWRVAGNGADASGTLTSELVNGAPVYRFGNGGRFRTLTWSAIGEADFGAGPAPFVASRLFGTGVYFLNNFTFNVAARTWAAGQVSTGVETIVANQSTLQVCADSAAWTMAACPAASRTTWTVTADGNDYTATNDADANDVMHFRLAQVGGAWYFVRAEQDAAGVRRFRLGIPDNAGPVAATYTGGDTAHHWDQVVLGADGSWQLTLPAPDDTGSGDSATSLTAGALAPTGLRLSTRTSDGGSLYLAASPSLGFLVGTPAGATAGWLLLMAP